MTQSANPKDIGNKEITTVASLTEESISALERAYETVGRLSRLRAQSKLSNSRTISVGKELKELIKVMSHYCC